MRFLEILSFLLLSAILTEINDDRLAVKKYLSKENDKKENPDSPIYGKIVA
ncbi:MAG: hypothetical protein ACE5D7_08150 [Fidelibacterota bacterium]